MTIQEIFTHKSGSFVTCGNANIYIEEIGAPQSPVLFMLHGGLGNIEDFNRITPALVKQFRLIGIDSRGHGRSSLGSAKLSYELLTDDLKRIIDILNIINFSILGFSDGGVVAYRYGARQDTRLKKIVTVGARWEISKEDAAWGMISGMTAKIWKEMFPQSHESYMRLNIEKNFDYFVKTVLDMWTDLGPHGHPGELISLINSEMLVVRGDNDPLTTIDSMAKLQKKVRNVHVLNIPFAEHVAFDDAPDVFLDSLDRFFCR